MNINKRIFLLVAFALVAYRITMSHPDWLLIVSPIILAAILFMVLYIRKSKLKQQGDDHPINDDIHYILPNKFKKYKIIFFIIFGFSIAFLPDIVKNVIFLIFLWCNSSKLCFDSFL